MKKGILLTIIVAMAAFIGWRLIVGKRTGPAPVPVDQPLSISKNSSAFDSSFSKLMNDYYAVRDALVEWDSTRADSAAKSVGAKASMLPFSELKADSVVILTAQNLAASMSNEMKGFLGERGIEEKRRSFNMLTDEMYNIVRTVRYGGETIFHIRCPMAFSDSQEAYWLNNSRKIVNPYLGNRHPQFRNKMVGCGEIVDSLDFSVK